MISDERTTGYPVRHTPPPCLDQPRHGGGNKSAARGLQLRLAARADAGTDSEAPLWREGLKHLRFRHHFLRQSIFQIGVIAMDIQEQLKRAATNYAAKNGAEALKSMLLAVTGVANIEDVADGDQMAAYAALADGQMRCAFNGKIDPEAVWSKFNGGRRDNSLPSGAKEIDEAAISAIWDRWNSAGRNRKDGEQ